MFVDGACQSLHHAPRVPAEVRGRESFLLFVNLRVMVTYHTGCSTVVFGVNRVFQEVPGCWKSKLTSAQVGEVGDHQTQEAVGCCVDQLLV